MKPRLRFDYLHGGIVTYPPGAAFGPRHLLDYELVWIIQGDVVYQYDGIEISAPADSMLLARPGFHDSFIWDALQPTRHAYLHTMFKYPPVDWPAVEHWPVHRVLPENDVLRPVFRYILANCQGQSAPVKDHEQVGPNLQRALELLVGAFLTGPMSQVVEYDREFAQPVTKALDFIRQSLEQEPQQALHLADLAGAAKVSPEYLCRLFRATFNVGPIEALRLMRLDQAVALLARSNLSVKEVAYRCGFASPYHFSRLFSQVYQMSPTQLREQVANGQTPPTTPLLRRLGR